VVHAFAIVRRRGTTPPPVQLRYAAFGIARTLCAPGARQIRVSSGQPAQLSTLQRLEGQTVPSMIKQNVLTSTYSCNRWAWSRKRVSLGRKVLNRPHKVKKARELVAFLCA